MARREWSNVERALHGAPSPRPRPSNPEGMLRYAYGRSPRTGRADTGAAAEALGVSRRTVQRWLARGIPERSRAASRLEQDVSARHQQKEAQRRGRRADELRRRGARVDVRGQFSISADSRRRRLAVDLDGDLMAAIYDALETGGPDAAQAALDQALQDSYVAGLALEDLDSLAFS